MNYSPKQGVKSHGLPHDPFKSSTVPRPIGWISTISKEGKDNLAPYSQYQNLTWDPPMVMFAANQSVLGDHERKDTVKMRKKLVGLYGIWQHMICVKQ